MSSWPPPEVGLRPRTVWTCQGSSRRGLHTAAVTRVPVLPLMGFSQFPGPCKRTLLSHSEAGSHGQADRGCGHNWGAENTHLINTPELP